MSGKNIGISGYTESLIPTDYVPIDSGLQDVDLQDQNFIGLRVIADGNLEVQWINSPNVRPVRAVVEGEIIIGLVKLVKGTSTAEVDGIKG